MSTTATTDYDLYVNGQYTPASSPDRIDVVDPTSANVVGTIADAGNQDVDRAVNAAQAAFEGEWSTYSPAARSAALHALADAIEARTDELAAAEVHDNGKLLREMRGQLVAIPRWYRYFAGLADKLEGTVVPMEKASLFNYTRREAVGVVGCITPWNSPLLLSAWKMAPALAAGNTIVTKPSEHASVSTLLFGRCFEDAGIPGGVFNVVTGGGATAGDALVRHPLVERVTFTGSGAAGAAVASAAAGRLAEVGLELGGKSPNIVFEDAPLDAAIYGIIAGIFAAGGQTCVAGSRALVHRSLYDEVVQRVADRAEQIKLGDPMGSETEMGPIANSPQLSKVERHVAAAQSDGAELVLGGEPATVNGFEGGYFYSPTIFGRVAPDSSLFREEVFGPVLAVTPFDTEEEAIALANDTSYGLAAGLWSNDVGRVHRVAARLSAGTVWANTYRAVAHNMPFGGYKSSGIGSENGIRAIDDFLRTKSVWVETEPSTADPFALKV